MEILKKIGFTILGAIIGYVAAIVLFAIFGFIFAIIGGDYISVATSWGFLILSSIVTTGLTVIGGIIGFNKD